MELNLKGKKALITGGSKGIGLAIKKALEKEGIKVISWSRSEGQDLMKGIDLINYGDLLNADILINNVGGMGTCLEEDAEDCMFKNYRLTQMLTDLYLKIKREWGRVITISSIYGKEKGPNPYFTAAKAAQIAYMKSLAGQYKGITFNVICPGCINTKESIKEYAQQNNMTLGEPEDVANIVAFLCSDLAKHINGAVITVDGGDSHSF
jgi:3-oxoacyl-[acyl-carrier protein] reductase